MTSLVHAGLTLVADFVREFTVHAQAGIADAFEPLLFVTAVVVSLFIGALLIDARVVLTMFYSATFAERGKALPAADKCTTLAEINIANPATVRWNWFRACNWVMGVVFAASSAYCATHWDELQSPGTGAHKLVGIVCVLSLAYLLGFFGVGVVQREYVASTASSTTSTPLAEAVEAEQRGLPAKQLSCDSTLRQRKAPSKAAAAPQWKSRFVPPTEDAASWQSWRILAALALTSPCFFTAMFSYAARSDGVDVSYWWRYGEALVHRAAAPVAAVLHTIWTWVEAVEASARLPEGTFQVLLTAAALVAIVRVAQWLFFGPPKPTDEDIVREMLAKQDQRRDMSRFPPPYPNGWYKVASSHDVPPGTSKYVSCLGEHLVVFRGSRSRRISVLDAYCPHLGANLGVGSRVVDDCIECPFHGWQFSADGQCTHIPYSKRDPPKLATIRKWPAIEYYGAILVYYDVDGKAPPYELEPVPGIDNGSMVYRGSRHVYVNMHIQDFAENSADKAHFNILHKRFYFPVIGSLFEVHHDTTWEADDSLPHVGIFIDTAHLKICGRSIPGTSLKAVIRFQGPGGMVHFHFLTPKGRITLFKTFLPVAPLLQRVEDVWFADRNVPKGLVSYIVNNFFRAFEDDIFVWQSKTYLRKAMLQREDGPIGPLRRWYKQFLSPNSKPCAPEPQQDAPLSW